MDGSVMERRFLVAEVKVEVVTKSQLFIIAKNAHMTIVRDVLNFMVMITSTHLRS